MYILHYINYILYILISWNLILFRCRSECVVPVSYLIICLLSRNRWKNTSNPWQVDVPLSREWYAFYVLQSWLSNGSCQLPSVVLQSVVNATTRHVIRSRPCWSGVGGQHLQEPAGERGEVQEAGTDLWQSWRPCWIGHIGLANKYLIVAPNPIMKCSATHSSTIVWRNQGTLQPLEYLFFPAVMCQIVNPSCSFKFSCRWSILWLLG